MANTSSNQLFYGNCVPCEMAVQLLQISNDKADVHLAQNSFFYYETWKQCEDVVHISIYYNMHMKNMCTSKVL